MPNWHRIPLQNKRSLKLPLWYIWLVNEFAFHVIYLGDVFYLCCVFVAVHHQTFWSNFTRVLILDEHSQIPNFFFKFSIFLPPQKVKLFIPTRFSIYLLEIKRKFVNLLWNSEKKTFFYEILYLNSVRVVRKLWFYYFRVVLK